MFFVTGALTGVLADLERAQKKRIEETATKLGNTYSELQASMEQLRRADRLSALGELSAGLAHQIRNKNVNTKPTWLIGRQSLWK